MKSIILAVLSFLGIYSAPSPSPAPTPSPIFTQTTFAGEVLSSPVQDFRARITKKPFGIYITPNNSPVSPEKFTGYHTGADVEFTDTESEVAVLAIAPGRVIYSSWVKGYGGVIAHKFDYDREPYIALYGHLDSNSLVPIGTQVAAGQRLGVLGRGFTRDTDNERKHLHLSFIKGSDLNLKGYVSQKYELSKWVDPLSLLP